MVSFPTRMPDCDCHSPALLDLFISSGASVCCKMVVSVSLNFPSNLKKYAPFHRIASGYSDRADWDKLHDHLRDVPWVNIFKFSACAAASEFFG